MGLGGGVGEVLRRKIPDISFKKKKKLFWRLRHFLKKGAVVGSHQTQSIRTKKTSRDGFYQNVQKKKGVKRKKDGYLREGQLLVSWGRQSATRAITAETRDNRRKVPVVEKKSKEIQEDSKCSDDDARQLQNSFQVQSSFKSSTERDVSRSIVRFGNLS